MRWRFERPTHILCTCYTFDSFRILTPTFDTPNLLIQLRIPIPSLHHNTKFSFAISLCSFPNESHRFTVGFMERLRTLDRERLNHNHISTSPPHYPSSPWWFLVVLVIISPFFPQFSFSVRVSPHLRASENTRCDAYSGFCFFFLRKSSLLFQTSFSSLPFLFFLFSLRPDFLY